MSAPVCLPPQTSGISATSRNPARSGKRFTITAQPSKLNQRRITVTDTTACITTSYSVTTAQELVKELASAVGMLVCTPETISGMLRAQHVMNSEVYD
ncbi:MAG: hypothetical protein WA510_23300 [Acidobacteriaceae bacterium]